MRIDLNESSDEKDEIDDDNDRGTDPPVQASQSPVPPNDFIFDFNKPKFNLRYLHPTPAQIDTLWSIYVLNVDPINRILHKPTLRTFLSGAKDNLDSMPGGSKMQALMFAIYFAAITSLTPDECIIQFGQHRQDLLTRYRYGTEQALVQARLLTSSEIVTLQALVIYLVRKIGLAYVISFDSTVALPCFVSYVDCNIVDEKLYRFAFAVMTILDLPGR